MKKLKVSLRTLFKYLDAENIELDEPKHVTDEIYVKTPSGEYVNILGVIRKNDVKVKVTLESGKEVTCGENHIFIDEEGNNVLCTNAEYIQTTTGTEKIVTKETLGDGELFDISIPFPHLYATANGIVHHNTTFIRGLLHHTESSAMVTYDSEIISTDSLFTEFLDDNANVLVLEDADTFLRPRSEGNNMISRFLNIGDGLPSVKGKKLIFSTNLPSVKEIDPALLRPGRTFDVLHFDLLNNEQAVKLATKFDINFTQDNTRKEGYSVAEIFTGLKINNGPKKQKFGFC